MMMALMMLLMMMMTTSKLTMMTTMMMMTVMMINAILVCQGNSHRCPHGCIPRSLVCDGLLHCSDGSDEASCRESLLLFLSNPFFKFVSSFSQLRLPRFVE